MKIAPPGLPQKLSTAERMLGLLAAWTGPLTTGLPARNMNHEEKLLGGTHRVSLMHLHACSSSCRMDVRHRGHESEKDSHPRNGRHASAQNVPP